MYAQDTPLDDWLTAKPSDEELVAELGRAENRVRLLKALLGSTSTSLASTSSPEREAILDVVREHPGGASPQQVEEVLHRRGKDTNAAAVQTNMSRMAARGMLTKLGRGRYIVASESAGTQS